MHTTIATLVLGAALTVSAAGSVQETLPNSKLEIMDPLVESLSEYGGRAILVEFFAHW